MSNITPKEARVLGVLIEKARTVPGSYPMSVNGVQTGCNQKSNRMPIMKLSEDEVQLILDDLRAKGFTSEVHLTGSRVVKYRHLAGDQLNIQTSQQAVLAELLLRGPQTIGEIRSRAGRMSPLESMEVAQNVVNSLMEMDPPLIKQYPPAAGSRAVTFGQLLCPEAHPVNKGTMPATTEQQTTVPPASPAESQAIEQFKDELTQANQRIDTLEQKLEQVTEKLTRLANNLGEDLN